MIRPTGKSIILQARIEKLSKGGKDGITALKHRTNKLKEKGVTIYFKSRTYVGKSEPGSATLVLRPNFTGLRSLHFKTIIQILGFPINV